MLLLLLLNPSNPKQVLEKVMFSGGCSGKCANYQGVWLMNGANDEFRLLFVRSALTLYRIMWCHRVVVFMLSLR